MTELLIDGDIMVYREAFAAEKPTNWGNGLWTLHADATNAKKRLDYEIERLAKELEGEPHITLSGRGNWRLDLWPDYKANRKDKRKPLLLNPLREHLLEEHGAIVEDKLEADDLMGLMSDKECIIVSDDKDLLTIPGWHYAPKDGDMTPFVVSNDRARYNHMYQTLTGDSTDGYPGCPGIGPVKAKKILGDDPMWEAIYYAFEKVGLTEQDALTQARIAYILRPGDYDWDNQIVTYFMEENTGE